MKGNIKRLFRFAAALGICGLLATSAFAQRTVLRYECQPLEGAYVSQSTMYAPFRAFCEAAGYTVDWCEGQAIASGKHIVSAQPGENELRIDGKSVQLPYPVVIQDNRVYVPVRRLAEGIGLYVHYYDVTKTANISVSSVDTYDPSQDAQTDYSDEDLYWLARIVEAEAGVEPDEGKLAVANVVINRVKSVEYPNTIYGVIFDTKYGTQFEPVSNGTIYNTPSQASVDAAQKALLGENNIGNALYFYSPTLVDAAWIRTSCVYVQSIGDHVFYE